MPKLLSFFSVSRNVIFFHLLEYIMKDFILNISVNAQYLSLVLYEFCGEQKYILLHDKLSGLVIRDPLVIII